MNSLQKELSSIHEEYYKRHKHKQKEAQRIATNSINIIPNLMILQNVDQNFASIAENDMDM